MTALAADPLASETVYAATDRGVYKTTNGARSWTPISLQYLGVDVLVVDSHTTPATLYAASGGGLWTSADGGASWSYDTGMPYDQVFDLQIDARQHPLVVHALAFSGANFAIFSRQGDTGWQFVAGRSGSSIEEAFAIGGGTLLLATAARACSAPGTEARTGSWRTSA